MKMKKTLCLLLSAVLLMGLIGACGKTPDNSASGGNTPNAGGSSAGTGSGSSGTGSGSGGGTGGSLDGAGTSGDGGSGAVIPGNEAPDLSGRTIRLLTQETWVSGVSLSDILPRFKQIEERTGCKLIWETVSSDFETVLQTRLLGSASECPDIVLVNGSMATLQKYIEDGIVYDLTRAYDVTPNIKEYWEEERPDLKGTFTYTDGGIYCLLVNSYDTPTGLAEISAENGDNAIWYRADIAKKLGFDTYPKTIEEFHDLLLAVHKAYPKMAPLWMWDWDNWESIRILNSAYGLHFNNDFAGNYLYPDANGKVQFEPAMDATKEWLTEMHKWYEEGLIVVAGSEEQKIGATATGVNFSGFYAGVTGMCEEALKQMEPDAYFMYMPFPTAEGHELTVQGRAQYGSFVSVIDNGDEEQCRAALQFLDYAWYSDYGICSEIAGVQGEGWDFDAEGNFVPNRDYIESLARGETVRQASGANVHFNGPTLLSAKYSKIWNAAEKEVKRSLPDYVDPMSEEQEANWEEINAYNAAHYCTPFPSFFMTVEDQDRLNQLSADLGTFTSEMLQKYILGTANLANFQTEFVDALYNRLNLEQVLALYQKYYDIYLANSAN